MATDSDAYMDSDYSECPFLGDLAADLPESLGLAGEQEQFPCSSMSYEGSGIRGASEPHEGGACSSDAWRLQGDCNVKMREPAHWEGEGQLEVPIYDKSAVAGNGYKPHMQESAKVLSRAFGMPGRMDDMEPSLSEVLADVSCSTNFEVQEVARIQNYQRYSMHKHFEHIYELQGGARVVFHGTTRASAASIASTGFRGAVSQRAKFGRGIYCSSLLWEALAYAEPELPTLTQTFLIVDLLQGPTTLGRQDAVDFGTDAEGKEVLTTTNAEHTIFCAKYENQLLATYRITVRFLADRQHTPTHYNTVRMYHPTIWKIIKEQTLTVGRKSPILAAPPTKRDMDSHKGISKGDRVVVQNPNKALHFCDQQEGIVRKIHKDSFVRFSIEMSDPQLGVKIQKAHKKKKKKIDQGTQGQDDSWIICKSGQLRKVSDSAALSSGSAPSGHGIVGVGAMAVVAADSGSTAVATAQGLVLGVVPGPDGASHAGSGSGVDKGADGAAEAVSDKVKRADDGSLGTGGGRALIAAAGRADDGAAGANSPTNVTCSIYTPQKAGAGGSSLLGKRAAEDAGCAREDSKDAKIAHCSAGAAAFGTGWPGTGWRFHPDNPGMVGTGLGAHGEC
jgi:hypothetical protein